MDKVCTLKSRSLTFSALSIAKCKIDNYQSIVSSSNTGLVPLLPFPSPSVIPIPIPILIPIIIPILSRSSTG